MNKCTSCHHLAEDHYGGTGNCSILSQATRKGCQCYGFVDESFEAKALDLLIEIRDLLQASISNGDFQVVR